MSQPDRIDTRRRALRRVAAGALAALMFASSTLGFARGRGRGADFDPFIPEEAYAGLPANLVPGLEPTTSIVGDGSITGFGGVPAVNGMTAPITSQSGELIVPLTGAAAVNGGVTPGVALSVGADRLPSMMSLKSVAVPPVPGLADFIRDNNAAIMLGKALFWDSQVGSDGVACASCHFHAGADNRMRNQINPGLPGGDSLFNRTATGGGGPNYALQAGDFPFHRLANANDRNSAVTFDSNDVVSSQGTYGAPFVGVVPRVGETCGATATDGFEVGGKKVRRVAGRNAPTTINAVFNYRNFWDGRANNVFNGVNPFGPRDPNARVLRRDADGTQRWVSIALRNSSLASQAVGPPLSDFEMSCAQKGFKDLGRKLMSLRPLATQDIAADDSVFGAARMNTGKGLRYTYGQLIRMAFQPQWVSGTTQVDGYTQVEHNFSLYWGLAIQAYEATLISDDAPWDRFVGSIARAPDPNALNAQQIRGMQIFRGKGLCISCHRGAEFTSAATSLQPVDDGEGTVVESMFMKDGALAVYDNGFYNIGVRPTAEDRGVGGSDPFGNPLSFTRNYFDQLRGRTVADPVNADTCRFGVFFDATACWTTPDPRYIRVGVDGAFKTPSLRNISLTQPYFHNGSRLTLEQVVEFYNRGGDRRGPDSGDTTGYIGPDAPNGGATNAHPDIQPLGLTLDEQADLVAFLRFALTDRRVACEAAPFDHPALKLTNGHAGDQNAVIDANGDGKADDLFVLLPAVGAKGRNAAQCLHNDNGSETLTY